MKKLINILLLIVFFVSFIGHNSLMAFSSMNTHHIITHDLTNLAHPHSPHHTAACSVIIDNNQNTHPSGDGTFLKSDSSKEKAHHIFTYINDKIDYFEPKFHILSSPILNREIKNYNYSQLIKIIKSNT